VSAARPRVAMVVQRCGTDVNGGAEAHCRDVAAHMSAKWDVTILTTTALDYMTWAPHYEPGPTTIAGVPAIRFDVDYERNKRDFDALSKRMLRKHATVTVAEQQQWMHAEGPYSTPLLRYIEDNSDAYDLFIFYSYLYATTFFGLPLVAEKSILAPLAHDEWPIHFPIWNDFFEKPRALIFNTPEERDFLAQRFPNRKMDGPIIGVGVTAPANPQPNRFRERFGITGPYAIYVGRIDKAKQCDTLLKDYAAYRRRKDADLSLVLVGRSVMNIPKAPGVYATGYIEEDLKFDAIAGAEFLIMPSHLESLSIALLEAWSLSRPVLVNAESAVLVGQTRRANAGITYGSTKEFIEGIDKLRTPPNNQLGENGHRFVTENYTWPTVISAYENVYEAFEKPNAPA
jgi:glycosyltransferase involved in cell wall biosynthesis